MPRVSTAFTPSTTHGGQPRSRGAPMAIFTDAADSYRILQKKNAADGSRRRPRQRGRGRVVSSPRLPPLRRRCSSLQASGATLKIIHVGSRHVCPIACAVLYIKRENCVRSSGKRCENVSSAVSKRVAAMKSCPSSALTWRSKTSASLTDGGLCSRILTVRAGITTGAIFRSVKRGGAVAGLSGRSKRKRRECGLVGLFAQD
jgi:hypothetical protein